MRYFYTLALGLVLGLTACAGSGSKALKQSTQGPVEPTRYTYRVVAQYPHAVEAYTQGFCFGGDRLWEGTGEYGRSELRTLDLEQGKHTTHHRLPRQEFGEGVAYLNGLIYQLTWESSICHVYDAATMEKVADRRYAGEGWGLTTDGEKLYLSNGSANIYRINPETFAREATITVTVKGQPVQYINELEWIEGRIWANVYLTDELLIINPQTGVAEGIVDLTGLLPAAETLPTTDVLNGIAYNPLTKQLLVTGKRWPKIYEIELVKQ